LLFLVLKEVRFSNLSCSGSRDKHAGSCNYRNITNLYDIYQQPVDGLGEVMSRGKEPDDKKAGHPDEKIFWFVAIGFIAMVAAPGIYAYSFRNYDLGGPTDWGAFAAYFSGIVTPIVALCSAVLFFRSIIVQREELAETRKEMRAARGLQLKMEIHRYNFDRQKQIERILPRARQLHMQFFKQVKEQFEEPNDIDDDFDLEDVELQKIDFIDSDTGIPELFPILKRSLSWYYDRGQHIIRLIDEYLDCDGDVYLMLDTKNELVSEFAKVANFVKLNNEVNADGGSQYELSLKALEKKMIKEMDEYASKPTKGPQSSNNTSLYL